MKKRYLQNKIRDRGIREEIIIGINQEIERNNQMIYNGVLSGQYPIKRVYRI